MKFYELKNSKSEVYPGIFLDNLLGWRKRRLMRKILFYLLIVLFLFMLVGTVSNGEAGGTAFFLAISERIFTFRAIFLLLFVFWVSLYLLEMMYLSNYFTDSDVDFEVLRLVQNTKDDDLTLGFISSDIGEYTMARLGFNNGKIKNFLKNRTDFVTASEYEVIDKKGRITLSEYGFSLLHYDSDLNLFLKKEGITAKDFKNTLDWVYRINKRIREKERWWTKDKLYRIPSLGKNLSFGRIYYLERFGHAIFEDRSFVHLGNKDRLLKDEVYRLEGVLLKDRGANALLVSRQVFIGMDIVSSLAKSILNGTVHSGLENRRVYILDVNMLLATYEDKSEFESMLSTILAQAARAGNVLLVIPAFSDFVENAGSKDIDVRDFLNESLSSSDLQVIALSDSRGFHQTIETDLDLMRNFEKIVVEDLDVDSAIELVQDEAQILESKEGIFFTYLALKKIVESADRYFGEDSLSDKSIDILSQVVVDVRDRGKIMVFEQDVLDIVEQKTGVPLGNLSKSEQRRLNETENILKQRIAGQDHAISTISKAMKRARVGVANPRRPLGSFLFIGPTGVGKTEASKALANIFFGDDEDMIRIDMSEFSGSDAVSRLIGDSTGKNPGILASKIRERQYGVLLLDEFEKAGDDVHNLFLQILDEGFFSDGIGERVNARNLIIIATSNAGSDMIYDLQNADKDLSSEKQKIIDQLISDGLFKAEFLNRFDDIVLFNVLDGQTLETVVSLMIDKLNNRIENQGVSVEVGDDLKKYLVKVGKNKKFGAREINRVIQKEIETKIAEGILDGIISKGDTITFVQSGDGVEVKKLIR